MGDEVRRMGDEVRRMGSEVRRLGDEERSSAARCGRSENANGERVVVPARFEDYSGAPSERRRRTPKSTNAAFEAKAAVGRHPLAPLTAVVLSRALGISALPTRTARSR